MQEDRESPPEAPTGPNRWPVRIITAVALLVAAIWLSVWRGGLASDWSFWALSAGMLATVITGAIWRELPGSWLGTVGE